MSSVLRVFDPESTDEETRRLSRLAQKCWSPLTIVYDPLKAGSIDSTDVVPHDKAIVRAQNADFVPSKRIQGRPECTVFVGNLSAKTTSRSLEEEFSRYGRVVKAKVIEDIITGRSRGYGFVEYSIEGEALKAYECGNRTWLDGNKIFVDMECGRLLPGWVPRRLGGGFNGRKESGQLRFGCRERPFKKPIKLLSEREINKFFAEIMGRKAQNEEKKDLNIRGPVEGGSVVDGDGRESRNDISGVIDSEIRGEKDKLKSKRIEDERLAEHKEKRRNSRTESKDGEEQRRISQEKVIVDSKICIKKEPEGEGSVDDGNLKFSSRQDKDFEVDEKKERSRHDRRDRRKHKKKDRHSRSDFEYESRKMAVKEERKEEDFTDDEYKGDRKEEICDGKEESKSRRKHKKRRHNEDDSGERRSKKRKKRSRTSSREDERRRRKRRTDEELEEEM